MYKHCKLIIVSDNKSVSELISRIRYIIIPGVGTLRPELWSDGFGDFWPRSIRPSHAQDAGIFSFENQVTADNTLFSSRQVESEGAELLSAIYGLIEDAKVGFVSPGRHANKF